MASEPLYFPNGSAITPDGATLIVSESFGNRHQRLRHRRRRHARAAPGLGRARAATDGAPTSARPSAAAVFAPDGMCLDAEGAVWAADAIGNRVLRLAEGGEILDEIPTGEGCFACMLGGDDGRTLFLCVAPGFDEHERAATREGRILATTVDVPHAGTP